MQLLDREALSEVVLRVYHHGQCIDRYLQFDDVGLSDAAIDTRLDLIVFDRPRGVRDPDLTRAELLEAPPVPEKATSTRASDRLPNSSAIAAVIG
jgi:hypothetical protein